MDERITCHSPMTQMRQKEQVSGPRHQSRVHLYVLLSYRKEVFTRIIAKTTPLWVTCDPPLRPGRDLEGPTRPAGISRPVPMESLRERHRSPVPQPRSGDLFVAGTAGRPHSRRSQASIERERGRNSRPLSGLVSELVPRGLITVADRTS
jgi:hypothetical protein